MSHPVGAEAVGRPDLDVANGVGSIGRLHRRRSGTIPEHTSPRPRRLGPSAPKTRPNASVACHGVRSHPVPLALVGECAIPVV